MVSLLCVDSTRSLGDWKPTASRFLHIGSHRLCVRLRVRAGLGPGVHRGAVGRRADYARLALAAVLQAALRARLRRARLRNCLQVPPGPGRQEEVRRAHILDQLIN